MTYLLDSSILIGRNGRIELLERLSDQEILLACCSINVTEVSMGMRSGEEEKTEQLLNSLEFCLVTREIAQLAGELFRHWRQKGRTLGLADATIAAVAIANNLVLVTDDRKHFPMPELQLFPLPAE